MPYLKQIESYCEEIFAVRRDLHRYPELGFEEHRTASIIAEKLRSWGIQVHQGIGGTGVVGVVEGSRSGSRLVGLRADMDALPMEERTNLPFSSTIPGRFHGCGHDGHVAILLATAKYLSETKNFSGKVALIFQPAEEGLGGARAMIADGLLDRFPCDEVYGLHNAPELEFGQVSVWAGPVQAGADFFDIVFDGRGGHAGMPHETHDPLMAVAAFIQGAQTIVSRNIDPMKAAILSICRIQGGNAYNVIPDQILLQGTIRAFDDKVRENMRSRLSALASGIGAAFSVAIDVKLRDVFTVLENSAEQSDAVAEVTRDVVGAKSVSTEPAPRMTSEDFADFLRRVPGSYFFIGHKGCLPLHHPGFVFDDDVIPVAASILASLVESRLNTSIKC